MGNDRYEINILCNHILAVLRESPGRYEGMPFTDNWSTDSVRAKCYANSIDFKDAVAILSEDEYAIEDGAYLSITKKGRKFYRDGAYETFDKNLFVQDTDTSLWTPKIEENQELAHRFNDALGDKKASVLLGFLQGQNYVNNPGQFVSFLRGFSSGTGIELSSDKLTDVCFLLDLLFRDNNIRLQGQKGYQKFIEQNILPFCSDSETEQKEQFKAALRKKDNKKWQNTGAERIIRDFMARLNPKQIALLLYCLSYLY